MCEDDQGGFRRQRLRRRHQTLLQRQPPSLLLLPVVPAKREEVNHGHTSLKSRALIKKTLMLAQERVRRQALKLNKFERWLQRGSGLMKVRGRSVTRKTVFLVTLVLSTAGLFGPAPSKSIELNQDFLKYRLRAPYVSNLTHTLFKFKTLGLQKRRMYSFMFRLFKTRLPDTSR